MALHGDNGQAVARAHLLLLLLLLLLRRLLLLAKQVCGTNPGLLISKRARLPALLAACTEGVEAAKWRLCSLCARSRCSKRVLQRKREQPSLKKE